MGEAIIQTRDLVQNFALGKTYVKALRGVNLTIQKGEFISLVGSSGSGKSTLLNLIGGLNPATSGEVRVKGVLFNNIDENQLALFRRQHIGFIFQSFNLISTLTALENVELPLLFVGVSKSERRARAIKMLEQVGLSERMNHKPNELSGGQQQRVSIARALINNPEIILADEPTGNLDSKTGTEIMNLMREMNELNGQTLVVVTHDKEVANYSHRIINLRDGIIEDIEVKTVKGVN